MANKHIKQAKQTAQKTKKANVSNDLVYILVLIAGAIAVALLSMLIIWAI
jgi:hypothetical protein